MSNTQNHFFNCHCLPPLSSNTVEPLNDGQVEDEHFCLEVVPSSEVEIVGGEQFVGTLSTLQSVHYRRFHCVYK